MTAPEISYDQLLDIETFADAIDFLTKFKALGDEEVTPFPVMPAEYKEDLVGVPFIIIEAVLQPGINDSEYYDVLIVTMDNVKVTIRDSSRGIFNQLQRLIPARLAAGHPHPQCGIYVRKGLRSTTNPFTDPSTGVTTKSKTYHLNM